MVFCVRKHTGKNTDRKKVFTISTGGFVTPLKNLTGNSILYKPQLINYPKGLMFTLNQFRVFKMQIWSLFSHVEAIFFYEQISIYIQKFPMITYYALV